jgi:hypothetical protein
VACDVRDAYRHCVADGSSGPEATDRLLREWTEVLEDVDDGPLFWLALAAAQWDCGRLEERVKTKALEIIDNGSSLGLWAESAHPRSLKQRRAVLEKLRFKLQSSQPAAKKIRQVARNDCPWALGEVLAYQLPSGKSLLLHLVGKHESRVGWLPIFAILDWIGKKVPPADTIKSLPLTICRGGTLPYLISPMRRTKNDFPAERITPLAVRRKPHRRNIDGGFGMLFWKDLPDGLKEELGLE